MKLRWLLRLADPALPAQRDGPRFRQLGSATGDGGLASGNVTPTAVCTITSSWLVSRAQSIIRAGEVVVHLNDFSDFRIIPSETEDMMDYSLVGEASPIRMCCDTRVCGLN